MSQLPIDDRHILLDGARVRDARKEKLWNQDDLADAAGVAHGTVERAEKWKAIRPANAQAIADALGKSLQFLKVGAVSRPAEGAGGATQMPVSRNARQVSSDIRIVGFDLDGTLIRGLEYSWKLAWEILGYQDSVRREGMQRYLERDRRPDGFTYAQWCDWCCEKFKERGFTKGHVDLMASRVRLTNNFYSAISALKAGGYVTTLISGGIDALLYALIPDAEEMFNPIFINEFRFAPSGELSRIVPTIGDFEGKRAVIEELCRTHGVSLRQVAFVGDSLNDEHIIKSEEIGLRVAYNARSPLVRELADVSIDADDLSLIVPHILRH